MINQMIKFPHNLKRKGVHFKKEEVIDNVERAEAQIEKEYRKTDRGKSRR